MQSQGRALRTLIFVAGLSLTSGLVSLAIVSALAAADLGRPAINFNIADITARRLPELAAQREAARGPLYQLVAFGDSTLVSYPRGQQVPDRIEEALTRRLPQGPDVRLTNLAVSGVSSFDYFFLLDEILRAEPDAVVFSFNLDTLSRVWVESYARPELAGLLAPSRIFDAARLPLHWIGLSFDRFLFYLGIVQLGGYDAWYRLTLEQARVGRAREAARDWFDGLVGMRTGEDLDAAGADDLVARLFIPDQESTYFRFNRRGQRDHFGAALEGLPVDHPVLQALGATLRHLEDAGVPTFVFLTPINVEHMRALGIYDVEAMRASVSRIEEVVRGEGSDFIDLHDLLPDAAYRDAGGHFRVAPDLDGPSLLAEAMAPQLLESLRGRVFAARDAQSNEAAD